MRKGPIIIMIGIMLALISTPLLFAYTLFDERTVSKWDFDDDDYDEEEVVYTYTFEDIDPGTIVIKVRGLLLEIDHIHVEITNDRTGKTVDEYDLTPGFLFWEQEDTVLKNGGDHTIRITIDESWGESPDFVAEYTAQYSQLGLITAVMGFPTFLIAGTTGIIWGSVIVYRKKKGLDKGSRIKYDAKYEGRPTFFDDKKEEWDEYDTSPLRKELWFEPATNPYDDDSMDYYSKKAAEANAFNRKWHQRWGEELEEDLKGKVGKKKARSRGKTGK